MKYPVKYVSASKGPVEIESMATPHIANALRKVTSQPEIDVEMAGCLAQELRDRGCTLDPETGQWAFPPKAEKEIGT